MKKPITLIIALVLIVLAQALPSRAVVIAPQCYVALLSQDGSSAPSAAVMENSIGTVTWSRIDAGTYKAEGAFDQGRTIFRVPITEEGINNSVITVVEVRDTYLILTTTAGAGSSSGGIDGILGQITGQGTPIEICTYPEP